MSTDKATISRQKWTMKPYNQELDGYPLYSPEGIAAIATSPYYQDIIFLVVNSHNPERDQLTRELAEALLKWWNDGTLPNKPFKDDPNCVPFIGQARQLLKLYEEEKVSP